MEAFEAYDIFELLDVMDWWGTGDDHHPQGTESANRLHME